MGGGDPSFGFNLTLVISIFARGCLIITHWLPIITACSLVVMHLKLLLMVVSLKLLKLLLQMELGQRGMHQTRALQTILQGCSRGCGRGRSGCRCLASVGIGEYVGDHESRRPTVGRVGR